jgi:hypothetical protein
MCIIQNIKLAIIRKEKNDNYDKSNLFSKVAR